MQSISVNERFPISKIAKLLLLRKQVKFKSLAGLELRLGFAHRRSSHAASELDAEKKLSQRGGSRGSARGDELTKHGRFIN